MTPGTDVKIRTRKGTLEARVCTKGEDMNFAVREMSPFWLDGRAKHVLLERMSLSIGSENVYAPRQAQRKRSRQPCHPPTAGNVR